MSEPGRADLTKRFESHPAIRGNSGRGMPTMTGAATLRRVARRGFPVFELMLGDIPIARMGRFGWFRILIGSGQRIEVGDGGEWRLTSAAYGGTIRPRVVDSNGGALAISSLGSGYYGINGRSFAYVFNPVAARGFDRESRWIMRDFEVEVARISRSPLTVRAVQPVELAAVFLAFGLMRYGIPGEAAPKFGAFRSRPGPKRRGSRATPPLGSLAW